MFRILTLAGGGLRGAFAIGFLAELEKSLRLPIANYFDLIAGTSTGAITASAIAFGMTAQELEEFYNEFSAKIFHPRPPYQPHKAIRPLYRLLHSFLLKKRSFNLDEFFQSRYCPESLMSSLEAGFGDARLCDIRQSRLIVPTVNLTKGNTRIFRTPHLPRKPKSREWRIVDVIAASAAAPTYFPHKTMPDGYAYVDGGLWANDPGFAALTEAVRISEQCHRSSDDEFRLSDVWMLGLGTGRASFSLSPPGGDAGMMYWAKHVAEVMSATQIQGIQSPLKYVLNDRYHQIDFEIEDPTWTLDNPAATSAMFKLGHQKAKLLMHQVTRQYFNEPATQYTPFEY